MLLAVGKASAEMMSAAVHILRDLDIYGILVAPKEEKYGALDSRFETFRAGHPLPDQEGLKASRRAIELVRRMGKDELLLCLISGGASAMLPAPAGEITLQDKRRVTEDLVRRRATIHEINTVRRHLSRLKGGQLVQLSRAATIVSLIISDVPGNHLPDIASGLTVEDPTTFQDAIDMLKDHDLWGAVPSRVKHHLEMGLRGKIRDTPKPGASSFRRVRNIVIADNRTACTAAKDVLRANRIPTLILTTCVEMEARNLGKLLGSMAIGCKQHDEPVPKSGAVIMGGETTVEVKGKGIGGRNQETALSAVEDIANLDGTVIAALGTDGIDGNSEAAGALIDGKTSERAKLKRINPKDFLARNDSYRFFRRLGDSLVTGKTGTNVGDLYLMISGE